MNNKFKKTSLIFVFCLLLSNNANAIIAERIDTDTSGFNNNLSASDDNVQDALNTIDNLNLDASPGGNDTEFQYNNAGSFNGAASFTLVGSTPTASTIDINGGTIDGTKIGTATPADATFTTVNVTGQITGKIGGIASNDATFSTIIANRLEGTKIGSVTSADATFNSAIVNDLAYDSSWNGSNLVPTRNAVYDKIETISGGGTIGGTLSSRGNSYAARTVTSTTDTVQDSYLRLDDLGTVYVMTPSLTSDAYIQITPGASNIIRGWNDSRLILGSDGAKVVWIGDTAGNAHTLVWNTLGTGGNQTQMRTTTTNDFYIEQQSSTSNGMVYFQTIGAGKMSVNIEDALSATDATFISINGAKIGNTSAKDATFTAATVSDQSYDATTWDNNLTVPTKNAVRDKIESISGGGMTIGGAIVSGTANRVLYEDSSNNLAEDADLQFDGTTLTANTVDFNGGSIDGTKIGLASAADATFTTANVTGQITGKIGGTTANDATFSTVIATRLDGAKIGSVTPADATFSSATVTDDGYSSIWNGSNLVPTRNAVYDKVQSLTTADVSDSSNKRYVTDAQLTVIGNTSGTNTGDQSAGDFDHNSLSSIQGGTGGEYYHLTSAEYTGTGTGNFVRASGASISAAMIDSSKIGLNTPADATFTNAKVDDLVYGSSWDGSTSVPTRNAVYDKIETIAGGGIGGTLTNRANNYAARSTESTTNTVEDSYLRLDDNGTAYVMTSALTGGEYIEIKPGASSIVKGWNTSRLVLGSDAGQVWFGDVTGAIPTTVWNTAGVGGNQTQMRPTSGNDFYIEQQSSSNNGTVFFQTLGAGKMSVNIEDALSATDATFSSVNGAKIGNTSAKDATFTNVTVTGSIDGSKIGATTPADATFSTIFASAGSSLVLAPTKTASFTAASGHLYPIDLSGAGADLVVTFPAGPATGAKFGWFVKTAHASNTYGCEALSTTSIRGTTSHDNKWSLFQSGERLDFFYDGSTWQVDRDGRIPFACRIELTADVTGEVANTQTAVGFDSEVYDNGSFYDAVTNKKATIKRRNPYRISIAVYSVNNVSATNTFAVCVTDAVPTSSVSYIHPNVLSGAASTGRAFGATRTGILSVGTPVTTWFASTEGSRGVDATTSVAAKSFFAMEEILE